MDAADRVQRARPPVRRLEPVPVDQRLSEGAERGVVVAGPPLEVAERPQRERQPELLADLLAEGPRGVQQVPCRGVLLALGVQLPEVAEGEHLDRAVAEASAEVQAAREVLRRRLWRAR